jgi:phosphoglycolate phosphatase-like HAD superfamily hydrolase
MIQPLSSYSTLVFDCDGVVLNSNHIKTEAFRAVAMPWGIAAAEALVAHHVSNGGISRHLKLAHFIDCILPEHAAGSISTHNEPGLEELLATYAQGVRAGLLTCAVAHGLDELRLATPNSRWCIVSGGDQNELREVFALRGLDKLFDGGIFGSPDTKDAILARELNPSGAIKLPAIFLGDSRYDYLASNNAGLDFLFVSGWTEVADWRQFIDTYGLSSANYLADLL